MRKFVAKTTLFVAIGAMVLTGCDDPQFTNSSASAPTSAPTTPSPSATTPSATAPGSTTRTTPTGQSIVGDWSDPAVEWTVHFKADDTYIEDFKGNEGFRVGTYTVDGDTVTITGGDGFSDKGTFKNGTIVFELGTLTRQSTAES